ncbi:hypothetical protein [Myxococcus eversor]|uniref:hypothetical protein n=1 Tax=Myxococcus eversor TaxID=2709661 RepID=UPI0013D252B7|nr:hypothetical protein [Myxococcus eversor]
MSSRNVVLPLCLALFACHSEGEPVTPPLDGDSCYEHVRRLSAHDRVLSTRLDHKSRAAKEAQDAARFVSVMLDSRENGDWYACGMTRAWVTEVFEGLERQYSEYRIYQSYADAYSLSAWLSDSTEGLFEPDTGELITDLLLGDRDYRLEVLDVVLPGDERALRDGCAENALILDAAILNP